MSGFDVDLTVGLKLGDTGFSSGIASLVASSKAAGARMGQNLSTGILKGATATGSAIRSVWDRTSNFAGGIGGLGAAMGFTALINDANQSDKRFRTLADRINMAGKETVRFTDLQKRAQAVTNQWAVGADKLADGAQAMFEDTGDAKGAVDAMEHVGMIVRGSGMEVAQTASLVGGLNEQFGITTEQIDDTVASLLELSNQGGVTIADVTGGMAELSRAAKLAGVEGPGGLKKIIALSNQLEGAAGGGQQAITMMSTVLSRLAANPALHKELKQKFGIDAKGKDAVSLLGEILSKNKGKETQALGELFKAGDAVKLSQAFSEGGFSRAIGSADTKMTGADLRAKAKANMESPAAKVELALEKLRIAFTQPAVIESLTKLAGVLPPVVDGFAKLASFAMDNKFTVGASLAGMKALSFAAGATEGAAAAKAGAKATTAAAAASDSFAKQLGTAQGGLAAFAAAMAVGVAIDQGLALRDELADGVPGQSGLEGDLAQNAAVQAVWGSKGGSSSFTDEFGNEHIMAPYFDEESGQISYNDLSTVGGTEPVYANKRDDKNGGYIDELMAESAKATEEAQAARARSQVKAQGVSQGFDVLATALAPQAFKALGLFQGGKGSSSSGPQEVKTPELVGLLRSGLVVSLNPASATAIGEAVAGKVGMPTVRLRTGVDRFE